MTKFSVITVCYNSAKTLERTLLSVDAQDHACVEHIVIDGGSTDDTCDLVYRTGHRVAYFVSEPDRGIYDAMNKGLARATGDFVAFLNADDWYAHPGVLSRVASLLTKKPVDMVFGDVCFFAADKSQTLLRRYRSDRFSPSRLGWGWMPAHPGLFARRSLFERTGAFSTDYKIAGDYEWIARTFRSTKVDYAHMGEVLVHMQAGGVSNRGLRSTILLNREVLRACRDNGIRTNWLMLLSKYPLKLMEFVRK